MFMVKKTEYTSKTFRIPNELLANLEKLAQENGVSVNNLMILSRTEKPARFFDRQAFVMRFF